MKAAIVETPGAYPVYGTFPAPHAEDGELLVGVAASALSPLARGRASGVHYSAAFSDAFVPGVDGVGRLANGRRVYVVPPRSPFGAMAEQTLVPAGHCVPLPDDLDDATAASIARAAGLALGHRCLPLDRIGSSWREPEQGGRLVYTIAAGMVP